MASRRSFSRYQCLITAARRRAVATPLPKRSSPTATTTSLFRPVTPYSLRRPEVKLENLWCCGVHYFASRGRGFSSQAWVEVPSGAIVEVPLAQTGEGIAECELLKWFVQEGDLVEEFQRLCEVQSDKATIEITSRYSGKVEQKLFSPGDIVKVGEILLKILVEENNTVVPKFELVEDRISMKYDTQECQDSPVDENTEGGVMCTPSVRHLAKQHGVVLTDIPGTGKDGRILKEDVLHYLEDKGLLRESYSFASSEDSARQNPDRASSGGSSYDDKTIPLRGFSRSMVKSMSMAAKVPHFHYVEEINCNALVRLKAAFQEGNAEPNVKHTYLPFLIKSLSMALDKYPLLNSSFKEESTEVILKGTITVSPFVAALSC